MVNDNAISSNPQVYRAGIFNSCTAQAKFGDSWLLFSKMKLPETFSLEWNAKERKRLYMDSVLKKGVIEVGMAKDVDTILASLSKLPLIMTLQNENDCENVIISQ